MVGVEPIGQRSSMGCGPACVAFALDVGYDDAMTLLQRTQARGNPDDRSYSREDLRRALAQGGKSFRWVLFRARAEKERIAEASPGSIVFIHRGASDPHGHYIIACDQGWMDPWADRSAVADSNPEVRDVPPGQGMFRAHLPPSWLPQTLYLAPVEVAPLAPEAGTDSLRDGDDLMIMRDEDVVALLGQ